MSDLSTLADPDRALALAYVPAARRAALTALFALDERLGGIVARTTEPAIGLMRLVWWRDALEKLDRAPVPAEPLLVALGASGLPGEGLAAMTAGWEALLDDPACDDATVALHATERGARLFALGGDILGGPVPAGAGEGWAMADLARHLGDPARSAAIRAAAVTPLRRALAERWPRAVRPLGQLVAVALLEAQGVASPRRRALRVLRHQITGR